MTKQLEDVLIAEGLFAEINPKGRKSNILTIQNIKNPEQTVQALRKENIIVAKRGDGIRIAPHHYNTPSELERFIEVLNTILSA